MEAFIHPEDRLSFVKRSLETGSAGRSPWSEMITFFPGLRRQTEERGIISFHGKNLEPCGCVRILLPDEMKLLDRWRRGRRSRSEADNAGGDCYQAPTSPLHIIEFVRFGVLEASRL